MLKSSLAGRAVVMARERPREPKEFSPHCPCRRPLVELRQGNFLQLTDGPIRSSPCDVSPGERGREHRVAFDTLKSLRSKDFMRIVENSKRNIGQRSVLGDDPTGQLSKTRVGIRRGSRVTGCRGEACRRRLSRLTATVRARRRKACRRQHSVSPPRGPSKCPRAARRPGLRNLACDFLAADFAVDL